MYYLTIIQIEDDSWNKPKFEEFEQLIDAVKATEKYDISDTFEIHSDKLISHHLMGVKKSDDHIDWVKKMDHA